MALVDLDELDNEKFDQVQDAPKESVVEAKDDVSTVPEKYRGKSVEDIVKMHQEAEKLIGKQAQEVGEVRRLADELLKQQLSSKQPDTDEETDIDFFEDPKKAVSKAVDKHPDVIAAKEATMRMKAMEMQSQLKAKHSDVDQIVSNPDFIEWVKASPVRIRLYQEADAKFDLEAADELLNNFKELRAVKTKQTRDDGAALRNQSLKAAAVDTSGTGESSRKVYRREDLIRLRIQDPSRYEALQPEIMLAYQEGRVR